MILLDTNVVSEPLRNAPNVRVIEGKRRLLMPAKLSASLLSGSLTMANGSRRTTSLTFQHRVGASGTCTRPPTTAPVKLPSPPITAATTALISQSAPSVVDE